MKRFLFALCIISLIVGNTASGWWGGGHDILTQAAVKALPEELPEFFRSGIRMIAHCSYDPDTAKNRGAPHLRAAEHPEHYLDLELLKGHPLPKTRPEFIQLCAELKLKPKDVGFVPYAVAEWTERLAVAFAEHRQWPNNPLIQHKCTVYAGFVAHYAQDMCQPLHLTIHFNGRKQADGSTVHKGIHEKVDALIEYLKLDPSDLAEGQKLEPLEDVMGGIVKEFEAGFSLVDRVYELADDFPSTSGEKWTSVPEVVDFATERAREATRFTAVLYVTAWELSKEINLPGWLDHSKQDEE
jgi:hypothetical protein